ncbi:MAG TPA: carboxypeptidase regulatory-like domain-containing protein [Jatrophihabitans sp.]|nr:carboxypeptidase regulatory-like domain-containing protein [Jatrophihabitans sp.]
MAGNRAVSVFVTVYKAGSFVRGRSTNGTGHYAIPGLLAGTGYTVCVSGNGAFGGGSATGYLGRCLGGATFNGIRVPSGATRFSLANGQRKTVADIKLPSAAAISGKVTTKSGKGLSGLTVQARNRSTGATFFGSSITGGKYKVRGLTASAKGYSVCFDARFLSNGATGFLSRCFKNVAWRGGGFPSGLTKVSVSLGHNHTGVNQALPAAGAISGKITNAGNGHPLAGVSVAVLSPSGSFLAFAATNGKGGYTAKGLAAAKGDRVCAFPHFVSRSVHYKGKCWKNVAWNGGRLPKGATGVKVTTGTTHGGISLKLRKVTVRLGSVAGKVTEKAGGHTLQNADVEIYTSGGSFVASALTNSTGNFKVTHLPASSKGYVVCARSFPSTSSSVAAPLTGWAPRCNVDVAWTTVGVPAAAKRWAIGAGRWSRTRVNVALPVGGEITGTTYAGSGTTSPEGSIIVELFTSGGRLITQDVSGGHGRYSFSGLTPKSNFYVVCFDGRFATVGSSSSGFRPQCFDQKNWNGTP